MTDVDFIVVGQGLAGSVLALKLIESGYSIKVIDKPELSSCSKVAAGVWNPVVLKHLSKSWMVDELMPAMLKFYRQAEKDFKTKLITERSIVKLFSEQQEIDLWNKKASNELHGYLDKISNAAVNYTGIKISQFGFSKVLKSGNLDMNAFLKCAQNYLREEKSLLSEKFNYSELKVADTISYKNINSKKIVFAEGYLIKNNPFFNYVPLKPTKGETITVETEELGIGMDIITKNSFIMCLQNNIYKFGATYNWDDLNDNPSEKAVKELQNKISKLTNANYKIVNHNAGVRPSVIDRRPVIGRHPKYENLYIFNGMGTKGVMLAPYFAQRLVNFIRFKEPLMEEVNVDRFTVNK